MKKTFHNLTPEDIPRLGLYTRLCEVFAALKNVWYESITETSLTDWFMLNLLVMPIVTLIGVPWFLILMRYTFKKEIAKGGLQVYSKKLIEHFTIITTLRGQTDEESQ